MQNPAHDVEHRASRASGWLRPILPEPVREQGTHGGAVFLCGEPTSVVVRVNAAAIRIGVFAHMPWRSGTALADEPIASILWKHLPKSDDDALAALQHIIQAAATLHAARLREADEERAQP